MTQSQYRLEILDKIKEYEKKGMFDQDVENDPPTRPLKAHEVDYTYHKCATKITSYIANTIARRFFDKKIKEGNLVIKEIRGIENYLSVKDKGVIITCNHFHPFDNYAIYKAIQPYLGKKMLYKIIREGNYTSFPGLYGYFFRHCNTLPLASNHQVLREMMNGVQTLLSQKEKILIYPEQGMWWNYRKPRPLKDGAFHFAVKSNVPILPIFITMEDTNKLDNDGFPIQAYTIHISKPVYPMEGKSMRENVTYLSKSNFETWKEIYETVYHIPLVYECNEDK